jgi:ubiquinone/menaquinone biosynthesis C-methylase UbiE
VSIGANKREWEELGELDPLWAIAGNPDRRFGRWELEEFFAGGRREIDGVMAQLDELGLPARRHAVLDFGCGVGRVTRALREHFDTALGVDISTPMLARARELNADVDGLEFALNDAADLRSLGDRRFDLVYTRIVLQHVAGRDVARSYIQEFVRLLADGGVAVFQIPTFIPPRYRFMPIRKLYLAGRVLRIAPAFLYHRLRLHPIRMQWVPEPQIQEWIAQAGGEIRHVTRAASGTGVRHATFYAVSGAS